MITEDYVSFETAKLLKEKGMNKSCFKHYVQKNNDDGTSEAVTVCTLQRAMKWLRKVYNLFISPRIIDGLYIYIINDASCYDGVKELEITAHLNFVAYQSPEEAIEAAIKYCLENLI